MMNSQRLIELETGLEIDSDIITAANKRLNRSFAWFNELSQPRKDVILALYCHCNICDFTYTMYLIGHKEYALAALEMIDCEWSEYNEDTASRYAKVMATGSYKWIKFYK